MRSAIALLLLASAADALLIAGAPRHAVAAAARQQPLVAMTEVKQGNECALIELSAEDPARVAKVLRSAWMEGGVKRGLEGSVLVPDANKVQIVCRGAVPRLKSFSDWIETSSQARPPWPPSPFVDALVACPPVVARASPPPPGTCS